MHTSLIRIARLVLLTTALTLSVATPVAAGEPVDPSTLNPPPNPAFNPVCERQGSFIVCEIAFSDPPIVDEPSELFCDGDQILISQTRAVIGRRIYDAEGNLLKRLFHEDFTGSFTNASSGQTVDWVSHARVMHVVATPGDITSGELLSAGLSIRITDSDGGTVLMDAGRLVFDEATGDFIASAGPHHFDDYFARGDLDALQPLCDALA